MPYLNFGKASRVFVSRLTRLIKEKFDVDIDAIHYKTMKLGSYFRLKCSTPPALLSNVVYQFSCSRDVRETYIGMSARHLMTRAHEHLNPPKSAKTAISQHICKCNDCKNMPLSVNNFRVIKKCSSEFETKIQEALLIKKYGPSLNKQLYASGSSFLLNVY